MKFNTQQAIRALILLGFSVMIYMMHVTGEIYLFINPKYLRLSQAAAILFFILFFIQITRVWTVEKKPESCHDSSCCGHDGHGHFHDHGDTPFTAKKLLSYFIILLPLLTGFLLPAKVLDSSIADKKGAMLSIAGNSKEGKKEKAQRSETTSDERNQDSSSDPAIPEGTDVASGTENEKTQEEVDEIMNHLETADVLEFTDSNYSTYYEEISSNIKQFEGRKVRVNGLVYKEEGFKPDELVVSRFLVTHCVADASLVGFMSEFPDAGKIEKDSWITVEGEIQQGDYKGNAIPILKVTSWKQTKQPDSPYLYPISIKR